MNIRKGTRSVAKKKIQEEVTKKYWIHGVVLLITATYSVACLFGMEAGGVGEKTNRVLGFLFGLGKFYVPLFLGGGAIYLFWQHKPFWTQGKFYGWLGVAFFSLLLLHQGLVPQKEEILPDSLFDRGGLFAGMIVFGVRKFFGNAGMWILAAGGFLVFLLYCTWGMLFSMGKKVQEERAIKKAEKAIFEEEIRTEPKRYLGENRKKSIFDFQEAKFPFDDEEDDLEE